MHLSQCDGPAAAVGKLMPACRGRGSFCFLYAIRVFGIYRDRSVRGFLVECKEQQLFWFRANWGIGHVGGEVVLIRR